MKPRYLAELIEKRIKTLGLTRTAFARRAGMSRSELYKILGQDIRHVRLATLQGLARALGTSLFDLIDGDEMPMSVQLGPWQARHEGDRLGVAMSPLDGTCRVVVVGRMLDHAWELLNLGTVPWEGRQLVCLDRHLLKRDGRKGTGELIVSPVKPIEEQIRLPVVRPGERTRVIARFLAPPYPCTTLTRWKLIDANGDFCFPGLEELICRIHVIA